MDHRRPLSAGVGRSSGPAGRRWLLLWAAAGYPLLGCEACSHGSPAGVNTGTASASLAASRSRASTPAHSGSPGKPSSGGSGAGATDSPLPTVTAGDPRVDRLLRRIRRHRGGRYVAPQPSELATFEAWWEALARQAFAPPRAPRAGRDAPPLTREPDALGALAPPAGFAIEHWAEQSERVWAVVERGGHRGGGTFLIRSQPQRRLIVEAPHSFFDRHSRALATELFATNGAAALLLNSVHRTGAGVGGQEGREGRAEAVYEGESQADVAHLDDSYFERAHRASQRALGGAAAIQIHGFRDRQAPGLGAIVGGTVAASELQALARALTRACPAHPAGAYGSDTHTLGGTTNVQAASSRARGYPFFHLELSRSLRDELMSDAALRQRYLSLLAQEVMRGRE